MRLQRRQSHFWWLVTLLALSACQWRGVASSVPTVPDLSGTVQFGPAARSVQSTTADVAYAATVSLIDISTSSAQPTPTNRTVATSVTTAGGSFVLSFPNFSPSATGSYILEAIKGLQSNSVSVSAARVRTLCTYQNGWLTLTNSLPGQAIIVGPSSTAVSIMQGTTAGVAASSLIGSLTIGQTDTTISPTTPDTFTPPAGGPLTNANFHLVSSLVNQALYADNDPVGTIAHTSGGSYAISTTKSPIINGFSPGSGGVGTTVTLTGSQFDPTASNDAVYFNGVQATIVSASANQLVVTVPNTTTGLLTVANLYGTTTAGTFTVIPNLGGQFPGT